MSDRNAGQVLEDLLKEKFPDTEVWVPGIVNGAMAGVLALLNQLPDADIIRIIRESK